MKMKTLMLLKAVAIVSLATVIGLTVTAVSASNSITGTGMDGYPVGTTSAVHIDVPNPGQCSGVMTYGNRVITAGHCITWPVKENKDLHYKVNGQDALPYYVDKKEDQAVLQMVSPLDDVKVSGISCLPPHVGDPVYTEGFPQPVGYIRAYGRITGGVRNITGHWPHAFIMDLQGAPGSSGSAVFNKDGKIIGLYVGIGNIGTKFAVMTPLFVSGYFCGNKGKGPHGD